MFLLNSRFSSSSSLWDIWISERFCIKNALFWGDDTNPSIFLVLPHRVSVFSSFLGRGGGSSSFCASFLISTTCQVGHFDSHTFWFLIEFFIKNLVLTGGRYTGMDHGWKDLITLWSISNSNISRINADFRLSKDRKKKKQETNEMQNARPSETSSL